ncbi:unnamed protein product [Calypogeia fissa]
MKGKGDVAEKLGTSEPEGISAPGGDQKQGTGRVMAASAEKKRNGTDGVGLFFLALLGIWYFSVAWKLSQGQTNLWPIFVACLVFETVNRGLSSLVSNPSFLPLLQPKNVDNFINTAVSLLHSASVALAVVGLLVLQISRTSIGEMWTHEALTGEAWPGAFAVLAASSGYFAYDQWDMLRRGLYKPQAPSLLVHHAVLLICFIAALYKNSCINYLVLTLVCEVHSIFLHLRKVLLLSGASRKWSFVLLVEWTLNWFAFFTARIALHVLITIKLLVDSRKFKSGVELPLALTGMAGLNVLNFILGQGLYKAFLRERAGKPPSKDE